MLTFAEKRPLLSMAIVVWLVSLVVGFVLLDIGVEQPTNVITYWGLTLLVIPPACVLVGAAISYFVENG